MSATIENFSPAWFASVMGTGILAITSKFYADFLPWLNGAAALFGVLNVLLFVLLIVPWVWRWVCYRKQALADLHDPVVGQFYATMPMACLVLAADLLVIGTDYLEFTLALRLAKWFWGFGAVLSLILGVTITIINFSKPHIRKEELNPAWFMPPVSLIVVPIAGAKLVPYWPLEFQEPLLIANFISWSCGFFLYLIISTVCFYRFICCSPLPGPVAPTLWINLGPIGAGTIALLNLASVGEVYLGVEITRVLNVFGLLLWGFGFWWLITALLSTASYIRKNNLPYAMSWWAFTFPLGVYAGATYLIAGRFDVAVIKLYGLACYWLLVIFWSAVVVKTLANLREVLNIQ